MLEVDILLNLILSIVSESNHHHGMLFLCRQYAQPSTGSSVEIYEEKKRALAGLSLIVCNVILKGLSNIDQEYVVLSMIL